MRPGYMPVNSFKLKLNDVSSLRSFRSRLDFEFDGRIFCDRLEAALRQRTEMKEYVFAAIIALDKTVSLVFVKPLHSTLNFLRHSVLFVLKRSEERRVGKECRSRGSLYDLRKE